MAKSNVELVIRAKNEASKALQSISGALDQFTRDQRTAAQQAEATGSAIDILGAEIEELGGRLGQMRAARRVATDLDKATRALREQQATTREARLSYQQLAQSVADAEQPTKRLQNQLASAEKRLESNRDKTAALQSKVAALSSEYEAARTDLGALAADEDTLARNTARAAGEFTALQTQLRETRKLSKGALTGALDSVDVTGLGTVAAAVENMGRSIREAGSASDLTTVDLKALSAQVDELESVASGLGDLQQMTAAFGEMRSQANDLAKAWARAQRETDDLARAFEQAEEPTHEMAEALGRSRALASQLGTDYRQAQANVSALGESLRAAGVDTSRLGTAQAGVQQQIESVAQTVASSRIELDKLSDAQVTQARGAQEAARLRAEAEARAQQAAEEAAQFERQRQANVEAINRREYEGWWQNEMRKRDEAERTAQDRIAAEERTTREIIRLNEEAAARQRQAAEEADRFEQQRQARLRQNQATEYANWWDGALQERDAQQANAAQIAQSTRVYEQAAAAVDEANAAYRNSAAQLERMADAHANAETRVGRLRGEQAQVAQRVEQASAAYADAEQRLAGFTRQLDATRSPSQSLVDNAQAAQREVKELGGELKASQQELSRYDQAINRAESALSSIADEFQKARERTQGLEANFNEVRAAYQGLATVLSENRDDTDAVADAQQRLVRSLERSAQGLRSSGSAAETAERRLSDLAGRSERAESGLTRLDRAAVDTARSTDRLAHNVRSAEMSLADFRDQGRTTLSLTQRLRGEVLALASAYIGLYGVGAGITNIARAQMNLEATQSRLRVAVGDSVEAVESELQFVGKVADQLKLNVEALYDSYGRFATAARLSGASGEETRAVFLGMAKAARVNKMSADQLNRAFVALEQIFSQGKVQAQEMREQLADAGLPGAMGLLRKALSEVRGGAEVTGEELDKMLEQGQIGSQALIAFARELEKAYGPGLAASLQSTSADVADFQNAVYRLKLVVAQSGFIESLGDALERVTEILASDEAQSGARTLGKALGDMIVMMAEFVKYADEVVLALKLMATYFVATGILRFAGALDTLGKGIRTFIGLLTGAGGAVGAVAAFGSAVAVVTALVMGWHLAEWAAQEFPAFGRHFYRFKEELLVGFRMIRHEWDETWVHIKNTFNAGLGDLGALVIKRLGADTAGRLASVFELAGDGPISRFFRDIQGLADGAAESIASDEAARELAALEAEFNASVARMRESAKAERDALGGGPNLKPGEAGDTPTDLLNINDILSGQIDWEDIFLGGGNLDDAAQTLADEMARALERAQQQLAELSADTLEERVALIRDEFAELLAYLKAVGNESGVQTVESLIEILQKQEEIQYNAEQQQAREQKINDLMQFRRDLQERILYLQEQGDAASRALAEELKQQLEEVDARLNEVLDKAIALAEAAGDAAQVARWELMRDSIRGVGDELITADQVNRAFAGSATNALMGIGEGIGKAIEGTQSWSDTIKGVGTAFRQFAAEFLQQIAQMILQAAILKALQASGFGGWVAGGINSIGAGVAHTGGVIGSTALPSRTVPAAWFANATRYHGGGIAGLKPNEVPTILEKGEEVLTRDDPRHALNGGGQSGGAARQNPVQIINAIDTDSMTQAVFASPRSKQGILNVIRANKSEFKSILGN